MTALTPPPEIMGPINSWPRKEQAQRRQARAEWVVSALRAGYSRKQIAGALGVTASALSNEEFWAPPPPPRKGAREYRVTHVKGSSAHTILHKVSLPLSPWSKPDDVIGPDPRIETEPRGTTMVKPAPSRGERTAAAFIAALRAELEGDRA